MTICKRCKKEFAPQRYEQLYCSTNCQAYDWQDANLEKVKETEKRYRENHPDMVALKQRKAHLKRRYGITIEIYNQMLEEQGGVCKICHNKKDETLTVDHDHKTGKVRGLLCSHCNHVLGFAQDNLETLQSMMLYLLDK